MTMQEVVETTTVRSSNYLPELADQIRQAHAAVECSEQQTRDAILKVGKLLCEARSKVPHGEWLTWINENCHLADRTVRKYVAAYSKSARHADTESHPTDNSMTATVRIRRDPEKRAAVIDYIKANPTANQAKAAHQFGISPSTYNYVRADLIKAGELKIEVNGASVEVTKKNTSSKIPIPDGYSCLSDAVRAGIELERSGVAKDELLRRLTLGKQTYHIGRDLILLSERTDLSAKDAKIVKRALDDFDATRSYRSPAQKIKPIATKVWGQNGHRFKSDQSRRDAFCQSISFITTTCSAADQLNAPPLDDERYAKIISTLDEAILSLKTLKQRLAREHAK